VQIEDIVKNELALDALFAEKGEGALASLSADDLRGLKKKGFSDRRLAKLLQTTDKAVREARRAR
jgi:carbamoyl-phosphate synthase large subunit